MALNFNIFRFYHIPKTGGNYFRKIIKVIGIETSESGHVHCSPLDLMDNNKNVSITIVRHPFTWYESYYRYRVVTGWRDNHFIDQHAAADSFEKFVLNMQRAYPCGYVTARYISVIPFCRYIFRTENLTHDFSFFLKRLGYSFPENISKFNVTPKEIDTSISAKAKNKLLNAESRIIRYLGY